MTTALPIGRVVQFIFGQTGNIFIKDGKGMRNFGFTDEIMSLAR